MTARLLPRLSSPPEEKNVYHVFIQLASLLCAVLGLASDMFAWRLSGAGIEVGAGFRAQ